MKRFPRLRFSPVVVTALVCLLAVSAYAQFQSGNIYGKVVSKNGSALPGVTVVLAGIGAPQRFITDASGAFRFLDLAPGAYDLKAELAGFGTSLPEAVRVSIATNADVTMTINSSVGESGTVTGEVPLLDVRKTVTGANILRVELDKVPSARDPWVILQQTPGVTMDRNNVGGNESGQQSVYVSKGTTATQSSWNVDGVPITDFAATGSSSMYYDFDAFEEMQITTGGTDPRIHTAGVQINMVTKRGTNDVKGSGRIFKTQRDWQADPNIPSEATSYLARINEINNIDDRGVELGGPIWRDRVWFWGAYGEQKIDILSATLLTTGRFRDKTTLKNQNLKFNAQPFASNSLTVADQYGAKVKSGSDVSPKRPPETSWNQDNNYGGDSRGSLTDPTLWKIEDTQTIGPNLYLTGLYSQVQGGFQLIADNGKGCKTFACGIDTQPAYRDFTVDGSWHRSYLSRYSVRPQKQYRLDGSGFLNTGSLSHELKFGYGYRKAEVTTVTAWPGGSYTYDYGGNAGDGNDGLAVFPRVPIFTYSGTSSDLYVGDTMMFGNITLHAGLRYDVQKGFNSEGTAAANPVIPEVLPAITFAGASGPTWHTISPRLGVTYSIGADRRTLLRGAYSRYVDQLTSGTVTPTSPGGTAYAYYYFNDLNHDNTVQRSEIDFTYGLVFGSGFDPLNPTVSTALTRRANDLDAPKTDELILGFEREIFTDFSIGVNGTYRKLNDFIETVREKHQGANDFYTPADYGPASAVVLGKTVSYFTLASGVLSPWRVIRNRPDYSQTYKGLELTAVKRMSNRWMLRGNLTLQDWTQDVGPGGINDPSLQRIDTGYTACPNCDGDSVVFQSTGSGAKGNIYINSKWAYSVTGQYQLPIIETSLGFNLNGRQGYALPYVYRVPGRSGEGSKLILATGDVDDERNPAVTQLDLRLAKEFHVARIGMTVSVDGFNILNRNTILQRDLSRLNSGGSNRVTEVLSPRVFRLGARFSF